jgi:hypothetical protein
MVQWQDALEHQLVQIHDPLPNHRLSCRGPEVQIRFNAVRRPQRRKTSYIDSYLSTMPPVSPAHFSYYIIVETNQRPVAIMASHADIKTFVTTRRSCIFRKYRRGWTLCRSTDWGVQTEFVLIIIMAETDEHILRVSRICCVHFCFDMSSRISFACYVFLIGRTWNKIAI